jgi:hypothetical protein
MASPKILETLTVPVTEEPTVIVIEDKELTTNGISVAPIFTDLTSLNPEPVTVIVPLTQTLIADNEVIVGGLPELYKSAVAKNG